MSNLTLMSKILVYKGGLNDFVKGISLRVRCSTAKSKHHKYNRNNRRPYFGVTQSLASLVMYSENVRTLLKVIVRAGCF